MINAKLADVWNPRKWWDDIDYKAFQALWPLAVDPEKPKDVYKIEGPCRLSYDECNQLLAMGVNLELVPLPGAMLTKLQDGQRHIWEYGQTVTGKELIEGSAVQITIPDQALMWIDEVQVETDCCTDALQSLLDEGWRILAVCPPNSSRRPDYVLGRRKNPKGPFDAR